MTNSQNRKGPLVTVKRPWPFESIDAEFRTFKRFDESEGVLIRYKVEFIAGNHLYRTLYQRTVEITVAEANALTMDRLPALLWEDMKKNQAIPDEAITLIENQHQNP